MVHTKLSTVVKAVRLRYAVPFVLLLVVFYWMGIHPWMTNWGSTAAERQMALPGDDLNPDRTGQSTQAITISAPSDVVWQWLVQVGQDRAGFYSYTWLEISSGPISTMRMRFTRSGSSWSSGMAGGWFRLITSGGWEKKRWLRC